jgi:hypothetical protein
MKTVQLQAFAISTVVFCTCFSDISSASDKESCVKKITTLENMLDAEKTQYAHDKCMLLKAAAANRAAMLDEINSDPENCGLGAATVDAMKRQYANFTRMQASACP